VRTPAGALLLTSCPAPLAPPPPPPPPPRAAQVLPMYGWVLNTDLWLWQAIEWVQFRIPIVAQARRWQRPPL